MKVLAILINNKSKVIGARIQDGRDIYDISTEQLKSGHFEFSNADVDKDGFVSALHGEVQKYILKESPTSREQVEISAVKKLLASKMITVYHGTKDSNLEPLYGKGKSDCDYGSGFYTTPDLKLAKEWAWSSYTQGDTGFVYSYELDTTELDILDLTELDSVYWVAELLANRGINRSKFNEIVVEDMDKFVSKYKLDTSDKDIIIGYRADDSYFAFAEGFVSRRIYKGTLESALRLGNLGIQVCIKSKKAFGRLHFKEKIEVDSKYRNYYIKRDQIARSEYERLRSSQTGSDKRTILDFI